MCVQWSSSSILYTALLYFIDRRSGYKGAVLSFGYLVRCFSISASSDLLIKRLLEEVNKLFSLGTLQKTLRIQNGLIIPSLITKSRQVMKRSRAEQLSVKDYS